MITTKMFFVNIQMSSIPSWHCVTSWPLAPFVISALNKPNGGIRPVATATPPDHYTGHSIATIPIERICLTDQFMGTAAGCEIVVHFIRHQPTVIAKVDVKNSFNEIAHTRRD